MSYPEANILPKKKILKNISECICRQLKYHKNRIRSEIGISLEIILDVFTCLTVSLVPLKFLL